MRMVKRQRPKAEEGGEVGWVSKRSMIMRVQTESSVKRNTVSVRSWDQSGTVYLDLANLIGLEFWSAVMVDEPDAPGELRRTNTQANQLRTSRLSQSFKPVQELMWEMCVCLQPWQLPFQTQWLYPWVMTPEAFSKRFVWSELTLDPVKRDPKYMLAIAASISLKTSEVLDTWDKLTASHHHTKIKHNSQFQYSPPGLQWSQCILGESGSHWEKERQSFFTLLLKYLNKSETILKALGSVHPWSFWTKVLCCLVTFYYTEGYIGLKAYSLFRHEVRVWPIFL